LQVASRFYGAVSAGDHDSGMLPIFDLANHHNGCRNKVVWSDTRNVTLEIVAAQDLSAGEEVCISQT